MQAVRNSGSFGSVWRIAALAALTALCARTIVALPDTLLASLAGLVVADAFFLVMLLQRVCGIGASEATKVEAATNDAHEVDVDAQEAADDVFEAEDEADPLETQDYELASFLDEETEKTPEEVDSEEWDTFSSLREQAQSVGLTLNDALGRPEPGICEEEGSLEEKIALLYEAIEEETKHRDAAIQRALVMERDIWNRTFAKTFTQRVNEVLRHVRGDRDEAVSTAIARERMAWRDALAATASELREAFETKQQDLLRQAEQIIADGSTDSEREFALVTEGAAGDESSSPTASSTTSTSRTRGKKPRAKKGNARKKARRKKR